MLTKSNEYIKTDDNHTCLVINSPKHGRLYFLIDEDDRELISGYNWIADYKIGIKSFYAKTHVYKNGKRTSMLLHRLIMGESDLFIDHINRNTLDNRKKNLRTATRSQNGLNRKRGGLISKNNTGYNGVSKVGDKFRARIFFDNKEHWLGIYNTAKQANNEVISKTLEYLCR